MPRSKCPLCGSPVSTAEAKPYARLSCGKCHTSLHLDKEGKLEIGEARDQDDPFEELKRSIQERVSRFPFQKVITWGTVSLVLVLGLYYLLGPADRLDSTAETLAQALASDNPSALKSFADSGTSDEVLRWYEAVHPRLIQLRQTWGQRPEVVEVHVGQEDRDQHKGSVVVSIHPVFSGARDVSLADPANATASAPTPFEEVTEWTLTRWGRWKLDGKATSARLIPIAKAP
jgi:ribosomal protein S27AE